MQGNDVKQIILPKELIEISGLAYAGEEFVYTHNDEEGKVFKVSVESGEIVKKFYVGNKKLKKDFEGIAVVRDYIFLTTSDGVLYRFTEAENNGTAEYQKFKTGLSAKNNIEGLCYDEKTNSLLLACKGSAGKNLKGYKAVYSYDLNKYKLNTIPRFLINVDALNKKYNIKDFSPTGIEVHAAVAEIGRGADTAFDHIFHPLGLLDRNGYFLGPNGDQHIGALGHMA